MHSNFIDNWPNLRFKTQNEMLRTSLIKWHWLEEKNQLAQF